MAHVYDNNKVNLVRGRATPTRSMSAITVPAGSTLLALTIVVDGLTARTGGAPTCGAGAYTFLQADQNRFYAATGETISELWYLLAPPSGSVTIVIPDANNVYFTAETASFTAGAGKASALRIANGASGSSASPAGPSLTGLAAGDVVIACVGNGATTWAPTGRTGVQLYDVDDGSYGDGAQYYITPNTNNVAMSWTFATSSTWGLCEAAFKEVNNYILAANPNSYSETGTAADFLRGYVAAADPGAYAATETGLTLLGRGLFITAGAGGYEETGQDVTLTQAAAPLNNYSLPADSGAYAETGLEVGLLQTRALPADAAAYAALSQGAGLLKDSLVAAGVGDYQETGAAAGLLRSSALEAATGDYQASGIAAALGKYYVLAADSGSCAVVTQTGQEVNLVYSPVGQYGITADGGLYESLGQEISLLKNYILSGQLGDITIFGQEASLLRFANLVIDCGTYLETGTNADFIINGQHIIQWKEVREIVFRN